MLRQRAQTGVFWPWNEAISTWGQTGAQKPWSPFCSQVIQMQVALALLVVGVAFRGLANSVFPLAAVTCNSNWEAAFLAQISTTELTLQ